LAQPTTYKWIEGYRPARQGWAVILCFVAVLVVGSSLLHSFADRNGAEQIALNFVAISLAVALLLGMVRFEASATDGQLLVRNRPLLLGGLLNWPWTERRIPRANIDSFRVEENVWSELKLLTIRLDDGSSLRIPGPRPNARTDSFNSFVKSLRSFTATAPGGTAPGGTAPSSRVPERVWRVPIERVIVCAFLLGSAVYVALTISSAMDNINTFIVVMGATFLAVAGVGFLLKRG
jgi:hypothetical protein